MIIKSSEKYSVLQESSQVQSLFAWARAQGVYISEKIHYPCFFQPGYLGTVALQDIYPEELLISVPNSLILSNNLSDVPELQSLFTENPRFFSLPNREHEDYRMVAYILYEISKGPSSSWNIYFDSWPSQVEIVTDWKEAELIHLQDSDFVNDAMIRKNWNYGVCKELSDVLMKYPGLFSPAAASLPKVVWCWNILTTRSFGGGLPHSSLIPVADFLNHSNGPTVYYYGKCSDPAPDSLSYSEDDLDDDLIDQSDCIKFSIRKLQKINLMVYPESESLNQLSAELTALIEESEKNKADSLKEKTEPAEEVKENHFQIRTSRTEKHEAGSQVTISYGNYSNRMLLTNYGFSIFDNKYDYARVKFPLKDFLKPLQFEKLSERYDNPLCVAYKFKQNMLNPEFLADIRGILWEPVMPVSAFIKLTSLELEVKVINYALNLLNTHFEEFETSLEEDLELLKMNLSHRLYFAVVYRIGVKKCLKGQTDLLRVALKAIELKLSGSDLDSCELGEELEQHWEGIDNYVKLLMRE